MSSLTSLDEHSAGAYKVTVVAIILMVMQFTMGSGRLLSRRLQKTVLAADDYVLLFAILVGFGLCALAIVFPHVAAYGYQMKNVGGIRPLQQEAAGRSLIAWTVLYAVAVASAKCAILLLYLRVFTTRMRIFTALSYLVGIIVVAVGVVNCLVVIFSCHPVEFAWNRTISGGKCIDVVAFARYMSVPNVVTGGLMLVMPLPVVWRLNIPIAGKIALTATFLHGIIGFIASCARLSILFRPAVATNMDSTALAWTIWSLNEPVNYVIAACLPTLRPIFIRVLPPSFFILSKQSSKSYSSTRVKIFWPSGKLVPKMKLETMAITDPNLTGPWDMMGESTVSSKAVKPFAHIQVETREVAPPLPDTVFLGTQHDWRHAEPRMKDHNMV